MADFPARIDFDIDLLANTCSFHYGEIYRHLPHTSHACKGAASGEGGQKLRSYIGNLNNTKTMRQLLFSGHSPNYVGVAYSGIRITGNW